jgi:ABC-2 type transport system permease protein
MLILLVMPVVQILLFGFAISTEVKNIHVTIVAPVRDEAIRQIADRIDASECFVVTSFLDTSADIDRAFQSGSADFVIVFSPHFAERLYSPEGAEIQWIPDATDMNTANTVVMYAADIVNAWLVEQSPPAVARGIRPSISMLYNPQMKSSYNFVPGVMGLILMLICAMMTSISIVRETETGTMEILLVSPVKPLYIIFSKMIPYLLLSCVNFLTVLLLSVTLLDVPIAGSFGWIAALSILFIIVSLSLGLLISTATQTQMAAMLISAGVLMMPVLMLSGMMFPIESMPRILQVITVAIPARWYIEGLKKLMIEGLPVAYVAKEMMILAAMAVILVGISLKQFKNRLE